MRGKSTFVAMLRELAAPDCSVEIKPYRYSSVESMIGIMTGLETEPIELSHAGGAPVGARDFLGA